MYSLVNIAVVVRDLARHDTGGRVATDLLHVLALDDADLSDLDTLPVPVDAVQRRQALASAYAREPVALQVMAAARAGARTNGMDAWLSSLGLLEVAPMGGWSELLRWVRDDLLASAWQRRDDLAVTIRPRAVDAVTDGLLASYAGADDPIAGAWRGWTLTRLPATSTEPAVEQVVAMVAAATPASLAAAGTALREARAGGWSWPLAMHDACWAIELTNRTRTAAIGQLEAVAALRGVVGRGPAPDVVAAVVAAVHATVAADLLASDTVAAMCRPLLAHLG